MLELLNEVICDGDNRPYQDVRITHTVILDDPLPDLKNLKIPERSPSPSAKRLQGGRIAPDEEIDETAGKSIEEINEMIAEREAKARATILEMVGDIPNVDVAPPENVLFVCKLNPVTTDDDLEIIFSRFGKIKSCEVIRDRKTGDSLQYAFVEFEEQKACEDAYFKMDNVLIDDRRIHVDFSQSVAKVKWHGKGRGVTHYDDRGRKTDKGDRNIGKGDYKTTSKSNTNNKQHMRHEETQYRRDEGKDRRNTERERTKRYKSDESYYNRRRRDRKSRSRSGDRKTEDTRRGNRTRSRSRDRRTNKSSRKDRETYERSARSRSHDRSSKRKNSESSKEKIKDRKRKKEKRRRSSSSD